MGVLNDPDEGVLNPEDALQNLGVSSEGEQGEQPTGEMAQAGAEDVEKLKAELEAERQRSQTLEQDINKLRSSLDRRLHETTAEYEARVREAEERWAQAAMANMDEQERLEFQLQLARERAARLEEQTRQYEEMLQATQAMNQYAQWYMQQGVPYTDLDFSSPDALIASGTKAMERINQERMKELEELRKQVEEYKKREMTSTQATQTPAQALLQQQPTEQPKTTPVVTQHGAAQTKKVSPSEVLQALEAQYPGRKFTLDDLLTMVEQRQIDPKILESIDWDKP